MTERFNVPVSKVEVNYQSEEVDVWWEGDRFENRNPYRYTFEYLDRRLDETQ